MTWVKLVAMLDRIIPAAVKNTPSNEMLLAENDFSTGPVIRPEKLVTMLDMFMTSAAPTVPWPISSSFSR